MTTGVDVTGVAFPAASGARSRLPIGESLGSRVVLVDRKNAVVDATASPPPMLDVASVTVTVAPSPATAGTVRLETVRSGPMRTAPLTRELFVSDVSVIALFASALAMMKYVPTAVFGGIVTVVVAELMAPEVSTGTGRVPRRMSVASSP